jgi:hypothetical protein
MKLKGGLNFAICILLIFLSLTFISSAIMHNGTNVQIRAGSNTRALPIELTTFCNTSNYFASITYGTVASISFGHDAGQIWVSVVDGEMTLLQALQSTHKLCPREDKPTTYLSAVPNPSHLATEISLPSGKTLQQAINDGDYCTTNAAWGLFSDCNLQCGGGTRSQLCIPGACGGTNTCSGTAQTQSCNTQSCSLNCTPQDASWGPTTCGACSKTCGGGTQSCSQTCSGASCGGTSTCSGLSSWTQICNTQSCPPLGTGNCTPSCSGLSSNVISCGVTYTFPNGCGGTCSVIGTDCAANQFCTLSGCVSNCIPRAESGDCGTVNDGCGKTIDLGSCSGTTSCVNNYCLEGMPSCPTGTTTCGSECCYSGQTCSSGHCIEAGCPTGTTQCGTECCGSNQICNSYSHCITQSSSCPSNEATPYCIGSTNSDGCCMGFLSSCPADETPCQSDCCSSGSTCVDGECLEVLETDCMPEYGQFDCGYGCCGYGEYCVNGECRTIPSCLLGCSSIPGTTCSSRDGFGCCTCTPSGSCTPSCPSSSDYSCGSSYSSSDGCGGTCSGTGSNCFNSAQTCQNGQCVSQQTCCCFCDGLGECGETGCACPGATCTGGGSSSGGYGGSSSSSSSSSSGGKVICTEAHRLGYMSDELYNADREYAKKVANEAVMIGYHSWAVPLVREMQKDIKLTASIVPIAVEWSKYSAYMTGISDENSEIGKIIIDQAIPLNEEIGKKLIAKGMKDYQFDDKFVVNLVKKYIKADLKTIDLQSFFKELNANLPK